MSTARPALTVRTIDPSDDAALDAYLTTVGLGLATPWVHSAERRDARRPTLRDHRLTAVFDGDRLVGTYRSWDWRLTVPGGSVLADAISSVAVLPTHRRRGALRTLITRDLVEAGERGVAAAVLTASEATIYGRFGFGPATQTATWLLDVRAARIADGVPRPGSLQIVTAQEYRAEAPAVFEAAREPGATDRSPQWWDVGSGITPIPGDPRGPLGLVLHRDDQGTPQGFLAYTWQDHWSDDRVARDVATVHDFHATTPAADAALWGYLAGLDLFATVRAENRRTDEALPWLLTDARAASRSTTADLLWVRILDPAAALTARRYEAAGRAVLQVVDPLGVASTTLDLHVDDAGTATVTPTGAAPDVTLPLDVLSSIWLGGGDLPAAAAAGRAVQHRAGALLAVTRMFRTVRAPWTGTTF